MSRVVTMVLAAILLLFGFCAFLEAQSSNATVSGIVVDTSGNVITDADLSVINDWTGLIHHGRTNAEGIYAIPNLAPGVYRIQVSKQGFKSIVKPDILLNTQDALAINFTLPVGAASETVTVKSDLSALDTESGSVSTVIDREFVQNLPLNGRSFNTLLQLTPGVTIAATSGNSQGQFSINGQRTSSNNFLIDGLSANFGVAPTALAGTSGAGSAQAFSALGGTSSLVSVEALQEFRVETSSYAPEFGRSPGGQVLLTTRAGTNDHHGGAYEYFRNDILDANDWFANQAGQPRAPERHNDFGVFLGGPIRHERFFYFGSYEGVRLRQPSTNIVQVPSLYARSIAPASIAPFLNAYPKSADPAQAGIYSSPFTGSYSNPSTLNAGSLRLDSSIGPRATAFVRYNEAPSSTAVRSNSLSEVDTTSVNTRIITVGLTVTPNSRVSTSMRANYSRQDAGYVLHLDSFGGATPATGAQLAPGLPSAGAGDLLQFVTYDTSYLATGPSARNQNQQIQVAGDATLLDRGHQIKVGVDYRRTRLRQRSFSTSLQYIATSVQDLIENQDALLFASSARPSVFLLHSTSLYIQDTWRVTDRLTLDYGLRWELNPAPIGIHGTSVAVWSSPKDLTNLRVTGTTGALWNMQYNAIAPRIGVVFSPKPKGSVLIKGGWGIFYDLASDAVGNLGQAFPNVNSFCCASLTFPVSSVGPYVPGLSAAPPYPDGVLAYDPSLRAPRSYQWNIAVEQGIGPQTVSLTYVGQKGRSLLKQVGFDQPNPQFQGAALITENASLSNYDALQVQYRRPMLSHLQALASYAWSHSRDDASSDTVPAASSSVVLGGHDYGSSDFDVRNAFSGAFVLEPGALRTSHLAEMLTRDWSFSGTAVVRSGFPFNASILTATIAGAYPRPDRMYNVPVWLPSPAAGGGKRLDPAAFVKPPFGQQGTEARNDIPGFGLTQVDLSVARTLRWERVAQLQMRVDAFNLLNHPNFTNPHGYVGLGRTNLESTSMTNRGLVGLNPLFQEGGPRSLQASLRLTF